jgi:hypothetical protein
MTKLFHRALQAAALALCATFVLPAAAQSGRVSSLMLQQWRLSQELGRYGLAQNDAYALLTAARLHRAAGMQPSRARVGGDGLVEQADPASMLARARVLAKDKPELLALVEDTMSMQRTRGTFIGPQVQPILMGARDTKPIQLAYRTGQRAFFGITSDRLQDIAFSVRGPRDEPLCEPAASAGELLCEWVSGDSQDVRVVVTNRSASAVMLTFFHD